MDGVTLYELWIINEEWKFDDIIQLCDGVETRSIKAIFIPDSRFGRCKVAHFNGKVVRVDSFNVMKETDDMN